MDAVFAWLAIVSAGLFAGGALYVTVAEHPARMEAGVSAALAEFRPSYVRAAPWQALMAVICLVCGSVVAIRTSDWVWGLGAVLVGAAIPFTLIAIMPVNHRLLDPNVSDPDATGLFKKWARLHFVRSLLGAAGMFVLVAWALNVG